MADARAPIALWRSVRGLPEFWRLLELRLVSQFGDGLFQAGLGGRAAVQPRARRRRRGRSPARSPCCTCRTRCSARSPVRCWTVGTGGWCSSARTSAGCCWCSRVAALLAAGASDLPILFGALIVNGFTRFVSSGLSAALPHVVPREQVVTMNSVATATGGGGGVPRRHLHAGAPLAVRRRRHRRCRNHFHRRGAGGGRAVLSVRFPPHMLGPRRQRAGDPRVGGLRGGHRLAARRAHGRWRCRPWRPRCPGWPRTGWCSASTRCWCW